MFDAPSVERKRTIYIVHPLLQYTDSNENAFLFFNWAQFEQSVITSFGIVNVTVAHQVTATVGNKIFCFWFCRTWTKRYLITSQTRVKRVSRIHHRTIPRMRMVRWCIRLTRLTLVCEVIRYRLVQVRQNQKKDFLGWRPAIAFLYLFLFHSPLCLTSFLSQYKNKIFDCGIKARM